VTVETIAGVVAAVAAATSLYYARDTVREAVSGRDEAKRQHEEQITEMKAATAAAAEQHQAEMEDRRQAARADRLERQLRQIGVVTELVLGVGNYARDMALRFQGSSPDEPSVATVAQVPSMMIAVGGGVAVLGALGLPDPTETAEFVRVGSHAGTLISSVANMSVGALMELQRLALDVSQGRVGALAEGSEA
jgi:hypothetical protein